MMNGSSLGVHRPAAAAPAAKQLGRLACCCCLLLLLLAVAATHCGVEASGGMAVHKQFHVFFHDKLNLTDVLMAEHAGGAITQTAAPFGSIFCVNDRVTATQDPSSAWLGSISGLSTDTSFDGVTYFCTFTVCFNSSGTGAAGVPSHLKGLHGTLNIAGLVNVIQPQPHAIAGGTGDFLFAQGTATIVPIDVRTFNQIYRLDLNVYWPFH